MGTSVEVFHLDQPRIQNTKTYYKHKFLENETFFIYIMSPFIKSHLQIYQWHSRPIRNLLNES